MSVLSLDFIRNKQIFLYVHGHLGACVWVYKYSFMWHVFEYNQALCIEM